MTQKTHDDSSLREYDNEETKFWKHSYIVILNEDGEELFINADHEQDALDYAIDIAEEKGWKGYFIDFSELTPEEIENGEYITGGNHGLILSCQTPIIKQID